MLPKFRRAMANACHYLCFWKSSCCFAPNSDNSSINSGTTPKRRAILVSRPQNELTGAEGSGGSSGGVPDRLSRLYKRRRKNNNHNKRSINLKMKEIKVDNLVPKNAKNQTNNADENGHSGHSTDTRATTASNGAVVTEAIIESNQEVNNPKNGSVLKVEVEK